MENDVSARLDTLCGRPFHIIRQRRSLHVALHELKSTRFILRRVFVPPHQHTIGFRKNRVSLDLMEPGGGNGPMFELYSSRREEPILFSRSRITSAAGLGAPLLEEVYRRHFNVPVDWNTGSTISTDSTDREDT